MSPQIRPIPGLPGYFAGCDGSIWSHQGNGYRQLKAEPRKEDGRKRYTIMAPDGRRVRRYGSYFVLLAFVGPCPEGKQACHNDGNCTNDAADNLRWDSEIANKADMVKHGTRLRGEEINTAKLTVADVQEIRRIGYPLRQHAERFGVTETLVSYILRRKVWKHVY